MIDEVVLRDVRFTEQFSEGDRGQADRAAVGRADEVRAREGAARGRTEGDRGLGARQAIETINEALRQNPNYIRYLYVDKLSDKISVIVSDQNTIMDLKGILENQAK